jgi:hypothetical protein
MRPSPGHRTAEENRIKEIVKRTACNSRPPHIMCADENKENLSLQRQPILNDPFFCTVSSKTRPVRRKEVEKGILDPNPQQSSISSKKCQL